MAFGVEIMKNALQFPCKTIAANAGAEGAVVVGKLLDSDGKLGFDAQVILLRSLPRVPPECHLSAS